MGVSGEEGGRVSGRVHPCHHSQTSPLHFPEPWPYRRERIQLKFGKTALGTIRIKRDLQIHGILMFIRFF